MAKFEIVTDSNGFRVISDDNSTETTNKIRWKIISGFYNKSGNFTWTTRLAVNLYGIPHINKDCICGSLYEKNGVYHLDERRHGGWYIYIPDAVITPSMPTCKEFVLHFKTIHDVLDTFEKYLDQGKVTLKEVNGVLALMKGNTFALDVGEKY